MSLDLAYRIPQLAEHRAVLDARIAKRNEMIEQLLAENLEDMEAKATLQRLAEFYAKPFDMVPSNDAAPVVEPAPVVEVVPDAKPRKRPGPPPGFRKGEPRRNALVVVDETTTKPVSKKVESQLPPGVVMSRRGTIEVTSACVYVLGLASEDGLTLGEIAADIERHNLRPGCGDLRAYLSHALSHAKDKFQCSGVGRTAKWTLLPAVREAQLEAMRIVDELTDPARLAAAAE